MKMPSKFKMSPMRLLPGSSFLGTILWCWRWPHHHVRRTIRPQEAKWGAVQYNQIIDWIKLSNSTDLEISFAIGRLTWEDIPVAYTTPLHSKKGKSNYYFRQSKFVWSFLKFSKIHLHVNNCMKEVLYPKQLRGIVVLNTLWWIHIILRIFYSKISKI